MPVQECWLLTTSILILKYSFNFFTRKAYLVSVNPHSNSIFQLFLLLFSLSVMTDSLPPHGLQHARLPCLSLSPEACSNSCPLSRWCHWTISSSVIPFFCFQSFPASGFKVQSIDTNSISTDWTLNLLPVDVTAQINY